MNKQIKISYIVPVYNVNKYLEECLDSLNKIKTNKEILIIDDRGTEDPYPIIEPFLKDSSFKYIKLPKNLGVSGARSFGMKNISKDSTHFYFLDSDDYLLPEKVDEYVKKMDQETNYICNTRFAMFTKRMHLWDYTFAKINGILIPATCTGNFLSTKFTWADFHNGIIYGEDLMWMMLNDKNFINAKQLDITTYVYRKRKTSVSNRKVSAERLASTVYMINEELKKDYITNIDKTIHDFWLLFYKANRKIRKSVSAKISNNIAWEKTKRTARIEALFHKIFLFDYWFTRFSVLERGQFE